MEHQTCTYGQPQMDVIVTDGGITTDDFLWPRYSHQRCHRKQPPTISTSLQVINTESGILEQISSSVFLAPRQQMPT